MFWKRRSTYFKCPACGHEMEDFHPSDLTSVSCPKCGTAVKRRTALLPSLALGVVLGLLIFGVGMVVFGLTHTRPIYVLMVSALIVVLVIWPFSSLIRKHTFRWTKV